MPSKKDQMNGLTFQLKKCKKQELGKPKSSIKKITIRSDIKMSTIKVGKKIDKTKILCFENKLTKLYLYRKRELEKTQSTKIRNTRGSITTELKFKLIKLNWL